MLFILPGFENVVCGGDYIHTLLVPTPHLQHYSSCGFSETLRPSPVSICYSFEQGLLLASICQ